MMALVIACSKFLLNVVSYDVLNILKLSAYSGRCKNDLLLFGQYNNMR